MTQFSMLPWTTGVSGDGATPYTQEQSNNFFRFFDVRNPASEGIALGVLNELAVSGSSSPLSVASGAAVCYGRYWNDSPVSLAVSTPSVGTTGGRVVLRCTWSTRQIRLLVRMSTDGVAAPPALTQVFGSGWEISLATFTITTGGAITLTDDRTFRKATFQVDTAAIQNDAVTTAKITNGAVTNEKLDSTAGTVVKINETVLGSTAASISFTGIPATYSHLRIVVQARGTIGGGGTINFMLRFNNDTTANYMWMLGFIYHSSSLATTQITNATGLVVGMIPDATAPAGQAGSITVDIPNYRRTSFQKIVNSTSGVDVVQLVSYIGSGRWNSTAAISRIDFLAQSGSLAAGTVVSLYGLR